MASESETMRQVELPAMPPRLPRGAKRMVRILLSESASRALDETGCRHFAIVGKEPSGDHPGRWVIYLRDASHLAAEDARDVLMGRKIAQLRPSI